MKDKNFRKNDLEQKIGLRDKISLVVGKAKPYLAAAGIAVMSISAPLYLGACDSEPSECCKNTSCPSGYSCTNCPSEAPCNPTCYCERDYECTHGRCLTEGNAAYDNAFDGGTEEMIPDNLPLQQNMLNQIQD